LALRDVPNANVSWTDENMVMHKHSDVGVAVSIPGGLITPIIRSAEEKTLSAISNEMKDLGKRAKDRKLKPEEYQGGTTAVSNMGMMGVKDFRRRRQPAACDHSGRRRRRAAPGRQGWRAGGGNRDDCDPVDRSSLPSMARWARNCLQRSRATSKIRWGCWSEPPNT
jgi:hypothetical protein